MGVGAELKEPTGRWPGTGTGNGRDLKGARGENGCPGSLVRADAEKKGHLSGER